MHIGVLLGVGEEKNCFLWGDLEWQWWWGAQTASFGCFPLWGFKTSVHHPLDVGRMKRRKGLRIFMMEFGPELDIKSKVWLPINVWSCHWNSWMLKSSLLFVSLLGVIKEWLKSGLIWFAWGHNSYTWVQFCLPGLKSSGWCCSVCTSLVVKVDLQGSKGWGCEGSFNLPVSN